MSKTLFFRLMCLLLIAVMPVPYVFAANSSTTNAPTTNASTTTGTCEDFTFPVDKNGEIDWPYTVKIIQQGTPVYKNADDANPVLNMSLNFNTSLNIIKVDGTRILVRKMNSEKPVGWIERSDILCNLSPLKGESGLEKKLYIQTATEVRKDTPTTVKAYPSSALTGCGNKCRELSRFEGYFVAAESSTSYLLSEAYRLVESDLIGWVSKENGFIWDTAYGLRPRENLVFPKGHGMEGQERTICAYLNLDDAIADQKCQPVLGGDRWYKYAYRIPILDRVEKNGKAFYKVVLPMAGTGGERTNGNKIRIDPSQLSGNPGIDTLLSMKHVDILFLIDGTASMQPYIDAIRGKDGQPGLVQQIIKALKEDDAFRETQIRFGYRIYRDYYAKERNLGEGLPLEKSCITSLDMKDQSLKTFQSSIDKVRVSEMDNDDYEENLFGGIDQAVKDLMPCPDNTKILFVIGDHGYNPEAQQWRGEKPVHIKSLIRKLKGSKEFETKNIVTFFIQTPNNAANSKQPEKYQLAYDRFTIQGKAILEKILDTGISGEQNKNIYFMKSTDSELNENILKGIKQFSNTKVINELVLDLRGGTALKDAITRLQGSKEYNNIPGLFWDIIEQSSWKKLGSQYTKRIYDTIIEGYIPVSEDVVEDIWLKSEDLNQWELLLRNIGDMSNVSSSELRQTLCLALKDSLEKVIRQPKYEDTDEPLSVYLERKGGLPVNNTSPLFLYSIDELMNPQQVPNCELIRLMTWINNARQMLSVIYHGTFRPEFKKETFPGDCVAGKVIPFINGDIRHVPLGNDPDMRYDHSFQKAHIYWVPKEYLP